MLWLWAVASELRPAAGPGTHLSQVSSVPPPRRPWDPGLHPPPGTVLRDCQPHLQPGWRACQELPSPSAHASWDVCRAAGAVLDVFLGCPLWPGAHPLLGLPLGTPATASRAPRTPVRAAAPGLRRPLPMAAAFVSLGVSVGESKGTPAGCSLHGWRPPSVADRTWPRSRPCSPLTMRPSSWCWLVCTGAPTTCLERIPQLTLT